MQDTYKLVWTRELEQLDRSKIITSSQCIAKMRQVSTVYISFTWILRPDSQNFFPKDTNNEEKNSIEIKKKKLLWPVRHLKYWYLHSKKCFFQLVIQLLFTSENAHPILEMLTYFDLYLVQVFQVILFMIASSSSRLPAGTTNTWLM